MSKKRKLDTIIEKFDLNLSFDEKPDVYSKLNTCEQKLEKLIQNQKKIIEMLQVLFPTEQHKDLDLGNEYNYFA